MTDGLGRNLRVVRRICEGIQSVDALTVDPQSLAACGQDMNLRRGLDDVRRERGNRVYQMLAGIKDQ
jgi:hypothetical protein